MGIPDVYSRQGAKGYPRSIFIHPSINDRVHKLCQITFYVESTVKRA